MISPPNSQAKNYSKSIQEIMNMSPPHSQAKNHSKSVQELMNISPLSVSNALRRHSQTESHSKSDQELMKIAPPASPVVAKGSFSVSREIEIMIVIFTRLMLAFSATVDAIVDDDGDGFVSPPPTPTWCSTMMMMSDR